MIYNSDLLKYKYDIETIIQNIEHLDKKIILNTQILTPEFCIQYIFENDIDKGDEDSYLFDIDYILLCQKHLTKIQLINTYQKFKNNNNNNNL